MKIRMWIPDVFCAINLLYLDEMKHGKELEGKVALISGSSRGIGRAIALRLSRAGAKVVITGKTIDPDPRLPGTIYSVAEEIRSKGGEVLPIQMDVRFEDQVQQVVHKTEDVFGRIDILVNNASAIFLANTEHTPAKRFDLMHAVNTRGTYLLSKHCLPLLKDAAPSHILMLSPPLDMSPKWFGQHLAYTMSKYGMSMCVLGLAREFEDYRIRVNALWPRTLIATAAVENLLGGDQMVRMSRKPEIVADAAFAILTDIGEENTGQFYIDEEVLLRHGKENLDVYAVEPGGTLQTDLFLNP